MCSASPSLSWFCCALRSSINYSVTPCVISLQVAVEVETVEVVDGDAESVQPETVVVDAVLAEVVTDTSGPAPNVAVTSVQSEEPSEEVVEKKKGTPYKKLAYVGIGGLLVFVSVAS